jgi:hypothetical protein
MHNYDPRKRRNNPQAIAMAWIGSLFGGKQPDPATVKAGIKEFIMAIKIKNCEFDERMAKALLPKQ